MLSGKMKLAYSSKDECVSVLIVGYPLVFRIKADIDFYNKGADGYAGHGG